MPAFGWADQHEADSFDRVGTVRVWGAGLMGMCGQQVRVFDGPDQVWSGTIVLAVRSGAGRWQIEVDGEGPDGSAGLRQFVCESLTPQPTPSLDWDAVKA